jgi:hypothetical protein
VGRQTDRASLRGARANLDGLLRQGGRYVRRSSQIQKHHSLHRHATSHLDRIFKSPPATRAIPRRHSSSIRHLHVMSPRQAPLQKYYPYLLAGAIVAVSLISYRIYTTPSRSRRLRRSNATRRVSGTRRRQRATVDPDSGGLLTNEQLLQQLNQEGDGSQPGIEIPESVAEALTETGHAAQEARGAGNVGLTVNGRSGRRSSIQESEFSFAAETKESAENQNLLTLLYTIAQVRVHACITSYGEC